MRQVSHGGLPTESYGDCDSEVGCSFVRQMCQISLGMQGIIVGLRLRLLGLAQTTPELPRLGGP